MSWYSFFLRQPLPQQCVEELHALAGPKVSWSNKCIRAGTNCAWMVVEYLTWRGLQGAVKNVVAPEQPAPLVDIPYITGFRERVSGFEHLYPHYFLPWQANVITQYGHLPSVRLQWPPGAGKTLGAIIYSFLEGGPVLFVTRSAARKTIANDVKRFTTESFFILEGQKPQSIPADTRVVITGWDTLPYHVDTLMSYGFTAAVWDEIHRASSHKLWDAIPARDTEGKPVFDASTGNQVMKFSVKDNMVAAAHQISQAPSIRRRIGTTATPIPDRLRNLWGQLHLLEPYEWGAKASVWFVRYCNAHKDVHHRFITSGRSPQPYIDELNRRLSFSLYHVPYSVTHRSLPPKRRQVTYISKDQLLKDEGKEARDALKQAAGKGQHAMAHAKLAAAAARKRNVVVDLIEDSLGERTKMVVLTGLRMEAEKLAEQIRKKLSGVQVWCATGDQTVAQRDKIREQYMDSQGPCIIVGTLYAWGESVNLQDTDVAFIAMLPLRPGDVVQVEGRFSRHGQIRPCLIHYVVAEGTYDEHVASILLDKLPSVEHVVKDEELSGFGKAIAGLENEAEIESMLLGKLLSAPEDDTMEDNA